VVDGEACTLALTNLETGDLEYAVVLGEKEREVQRFPVRTGEGIIGWVAQQGKPVLAPDVTRHPLWKREIAEKIGFPTRTIVCVPWW
jgi:signal transduction protein with GAF and PtsI domain